MRDIKPIATIYHGVQFRSRTEAQWAAFFDAAGMPWAYEPTRYDLSQAPRLREDPARYAGLESLSYLPDFHLDGSVWLEVKPDTDLLAIETQRLELLANLTRETVLLVCGEPWPDKYQLYCFSEFWAEGGDPLLDPRVFSRCRKCNGLWHYSENGWGSLNCEVGCRGETTLDLPLSVFETARKARFQRL